VMPAVASFGGSALGVRETVAEWPSHLYTAAASAVLLSERPFLDTGRSASGSRLVPHSIAGEVVRVIGIWSAPSLIRGVDRPTTCPLVEQARNERVETGPDVTGSRFVRPSLARSLKQAARSSGGALDRRKGQSRSRRGSRPCVRPGRRGA
jgi:hypothetical protein